LVSSEFNETLDEFPDRLLADRFLLPHLRS
jgi:hypothetical protein